MQHETVLAASFLPFLSFFPHFLPLLHFSLLFPLLLLFFSFFFFCLSFSSFASFSVKGVVIPIVKKGWERSEGNQEKFLKKNECEEDAEKRILKKKETKI
jgi:hypothetical protein